MFWVKSARRSVIRHREWIKRILNRHTDAIDTYSERMSCIREYVRRERGRHLRAVTERAHVLEVGKELHVCVANFVIKRAVQVFTVKWGDGRRVHRDINTLFYTRQPDT